MYGLCKFGPTCKYDHPLVGYSYNYGMNLPALSINPTNFPYQRNSSPPHSLESSPSKSPKYPDWKGKQEAASNKNSNANTPEDSSEKARSPSAKAEVPEGHSD